MRPDRRVPFFPAAAPQIAQVVRELKRSGHSPRMAVLAGKKHYCVNQHARSKPSVDQACDDLIKDSACSYFKGVASQLNADFSWRVHDVEDLAAFGRGRKACPYYLSRKWASEAELVFGPYSYLVDPVIRRSMGIGEAPAARRWAGQQAACFRAGRGGR